jgi:DtxR family transcriptional regulator, Mn-dependent transcriptional regulator
MMDPVLALLTFAFVALLAVLLLWPDRGVVARLVRLAGTTERVRLEDSLKHLYKCEYAVRLCSVESMAGSVGVSRTRAVDLLSRLEELGLARAVGEGFVLTDEGRDYALHIVRTHRLLERYLADHTGVLPEDWHQEAERREHKLTPAERESLASELGHPLYDPHGDPIPTRDGLRPDLTGVPLTSLEPGEVAAIVHLGDEPREIFEAISAAGLTPSMTVRAMESASGEVRFEAGGRELALKPVVARNVTVERLPGASSAEMGADTLADLREGESARVLEIHPGFGGPQRRRLLDLGLVPGTMVEAEMRSPGGDPVAYRVRGALIALRSDQARWIHVDRRAEERGREGGDGQGAHGIGKASLPGADANGNGDLQGADGRGDARGHGAHGGPGAPETPEA